MVLRRGASAIVLMVLAGLSLWAGGPVLAAWVVLLSGRMAFEWLRLVEREVPPSGLALFVAAIIAGVAAVLCGRPDLAAPFIALGALGAGLDGSRRGKGFLWQAAGVLCLGLPAATFVALAEIPDHGKLVILWIFAAVWASDVGAWLAGNLFGGPKLWPALSPKKTWAGLAGALASAGLAGGAVALVLGAPNPLAAALLGAIAGLLGQGGDLSESALKRHFHAKDAGDIIPGHGGFLDRLDSLLAVTLAVGAMLVFVPEGPLGVTW